MSNQPHIASPAKSRAASAWFNALISETVNFEQIGVHAAMLSVRLHPTADPNRAAARARTLLGLVLRPTDRVEQTTPLSFSVLLSPQKDLAETVALATVVSKAFEDADILASTGFAQRRVGESLLDTWARAEAELDRAAYRAENNDGLTLS